MVDGADDSDRAAILARRQRFIALALSGLSVACGDDGNTTSPMPCLDIGPQTDSASTTGASATDSMSGPVETSAATTSATESSGTTGMPMPCLDVAPDSSSGTTDAEGSTTTSGDTSGTSGSTGAPMPCLVPPGG